MTIHGTGTPIRLSEIATEFGGATPYRLGNYYAGGANVPSGTPGIPTSGSINLNSFYSKSKSVPGSASYTTPGTSSFTVPAAGTWTTLTVTVDGGWRLGCQP
jgi:hypothetical protein